MLARTSAHKARILPTPLTPCAGTGPDGGGAGTLAGWCKFKLARASASKARPCAWSSVCLSVRPDGRAPGLPSLRL
jgi:hypothetical protein